jgi:hypothetical protein
MGVAKPSSKPECCDEGRGKPNDPVPDFGPKLIILPSNFVGNRKIPDQPYANTLVSIDEEGNMNLVDKAAFQLAANRDLIQSTTTLNNFNVDGDNHGSWIITEALGAVVTVNVMPAVGTINGTPAPAPNSVIILTQNSNAALTFVAAPGVTLRSPGLNRAYGRNSTVTLMAKSEFEWFLGGDVGFGEVAVP